jgi:hypothetical protein
MSNVQLAYIVFFNKKMPLNHLNITHFSLLISHYHKQGLVGGGAPHSLLKSGAVSTAKLK